MIKYVFLSAPIEDIRLALIAGKSKGPPNTEN
jgi:hypothetical protein